MLDEILSSKPATILAADDIRYDDYCRTLDGQLVPYEQAEADLQDTLSYVTWSTGPNSFALRTFRETHVRLRFESGEVPEWRSFDLDWTHEAMHIRDLLEGGAGPLAVHALRVWVSYVSLRGPRAGQTIEYARPGLRVDR